MSSVHSCNNCFSWILMWNTKSCTKLYTDQLRLWGKNASLSFFAFLLNRWQLFSVNVPCKPYFGHEKWNTQTRRVTVFLATPWPFFPQIVLRVPEKRNPRSWNSLLNWRYQILPWLRCRTRSINQGRSFSNPPCQNLPNLNLVLVNLKCSNICSVNSPKLFYPLLCAFCLIDSIETSLSDTCSASRT